MFLSSIKTCRNFICTTKDRSPPLLNYTFPLEWKKGDNWVSGRDPGRRFPAWKAPDVASSSSQDYARKRTIKRTLFSFLKYRVTYEVPSSRVIFLLELCHVKRDAAPWLSVSADVVSFWEGTWISLQFMKLHIPRFLFMWFFFFEFLNFQQFLKICSPLTFITEIIKFSISVTLCVI